MDRLEKRFATVASTSRRLGFGRGVFRTYGDSATCVHAEHDGAGSGRHVDVFIHFHLIVNPSFGRSCDLGYRPLFANTRSTDHGRDHRVSGVIPLPIHHA